MASPHQKNARSKPLSRVFFRSIHPKAFIYLEQACPRVYAPNPYPLGLGCGPTQSTYGTFETHVDCCHMMPHHPVPVATNTAPAFAAGPSSSGPLCAPAREPLEKLDFRVSGGNPCLLANPFFLTLQTFFSTLPCFFNPSPFQFNPPLVFFNPPPFFFNPPPFLSDPPPLPFNPPFLFLPTLWPTPAATAPSNGLGLGWFLSGFGFRVGLRRWV